MLAAGLEKTLVQTGSDDNVIIVRRSAENEVQSGIYRDQATLLGSVPDIAYGINGERLVSKEVMVLLVMPKRGTDKPSNVTIRGVSATGITLRPQVHIVEGRMFRPGTTEIIAGRKIVEKYGWQIGDQIPIKGTIFPGTWHFVLRGIYHGATPKIDETQFFFHWKFLNEVSKHISPDKTNQIGIILVRLKRAEDAPLVAQRIDKMFSNSRAETLTETEKAFQLGFVSMTEAILLVIQVVSFLVIAIIMAVMANTMAMTARERKQEYATLKALGFPARFIVGLIVGESLLLALVAGAVGVMCIFPTARYVATKFGTLFPIFTVSNHTLWLAGAAALSVGMVAALAPAWRAARIPVSEGMRAVV
jgi:putative ABC transport system permease protein